MKKLLLALIAVLILISVPEARTDPSTLPLVQQGDLFYRGAFRVPDSAIDGADLSYGGRAIAFNQAKHSLFIGGIYGSKVAEITIPAALVTSADPMALPQSTYAQTSFVDPTDGHMGELSTSSTVLGGLLVRPDRLIGSAAIYYDGTGAAQVSHFSRSTSLTTPSFSGWSKVGDRPGFTAGYMSEIPAEHQARLGGTALTGQCCLPIITRTSFGPAASAFDPAKVGQALVPAVPLLYYDSLHPTLGPWEGSNLNYGATTTVAGVVIIPGTRSALFFGRNGLGPYCYGDGVNDPTLVVPGKCYDPTNSSKGQHAYPYRYQIWAYDLNDFAAVKAGTKQPWDVKPYGVWPLDLPFPNRDDLGGVTLDAQTKTTYVSQLSAQIIGCCGRMPVIHALGFKDSTTQTDPTIDQLKAMIASLESRVAEIKKTLQAALPMPNNTKPALKTAVNKALALTTLPPPPVEPPPPPPPVDPPPPPPSAGCTGSGTTWTCGAGSTIKDVYNSYVAGTDPVTITMAAGTYTWTNPGETIFLTNTKGLTLQCATVRACVVQHAAYPIMYSTDISGENIKTYRLTGFDVWGGTGNVFQMRRDGAGSGSLTNCRVDNNTIRDMVGGSVAITLGGGNGAFTPKCVVDNNIFRGASNFLPIYVLGPGFDIGLPAPYVNFHPYDATLRGTANNVFFEDNVITFSTMSHPSTGCSDAWSAAGLVIRNNSSTNCLWTSHGTIHLGGAYNFEFYRNTLIRTSGSGGTWENGQRLVHHQGSGESTFFDNRVTVVGTISQYALEMAHYRTADEVALGYPEGGWAAYGNECHGAGFLDGNTAPTETYYGYPCWMQPGRAPASSGPGTLAPLYVWNNTNTADGAKVHLQINNFLAGPPTVHEHHVVADRDLYNSVSKDAQTSPTSPFNGTTGMGFGTIANRPTTCTTNAKEAGGGVAYWATDEGEWDSTHAGPDGQLYRCSAPNVWTLHYKPYQYPHPLRLVKP